MSLPLLSLPALESSQRSTHLSQPTPYLAPAIVGSHCKPTRTTDQDAMPQLHPPPLEVDRSVSQESLVPPLLVPLTAIEELSQSIPQPSLPALETSQIARHCSQPTPQVAPVSRRSINEDVEMRPSRELPNAEDPPKIDDLHGHPTCQLSQSSSPPAARPAVMQEPVQSAQIASKKAADIKLSGKDSDVRGCTKVNVLSLLAIQIM